MSEEKKLMENAKRKSLKVYKQTCLEYLPNSLLILKVHPLGLRAILSTHQKYMEI